MTDHTRNILNSLANSSLWDEFRDSFLKDYLAQVKDVTNDIGNPQLFELMKLNVGAAYIGRVMAATAIEDMIRAVDNCKTDSRKTESYI